MVWTVIFLCFLGLSVPQAAEAENSTQMYYAKLTIDKNAIKNVSETLKPFVNDARLNVDNLKVTTVCMNDSLGKKCSCTPGHRWSDNICQSDQGCCGNTECIFRRSPAQMCVLNTSVAVTGYVVVEGQKYQGCLDDETSTEYKTCNHHLLLKMKNVYSTLKGFDTLTITGFRIGSIIVNFNLTVASSVSARDLTERSLKLTDSLSPSAFFYLETSGIVQVSMPPKPVCYNRNIVFSCTSPEDLKDHAQWYLHQMNRKVKITTGTVSTVTRSEATRTEVALRSVTEHWAGEYVCVVEQKLGSSTIAHKASGVMDISLLPHIDVSTTPAFPLCRKSSDFVSVTAACEIRKSSERYNVTWKGDKITLKSSFRGEETERFTADKIISCDRATRATELWCVFENRCSQVTEASVSINVIYEGDKYCRAEGEWTNTKAGFTAVVKCKGAVGLRQRKCDLEGTWGEEESACVNMDLDNVLQDAIISDTGLGLLDTNVGNVLSGLDGVTNNTVNINSYANLNTSVTVLSTLKEKLERVNTESVDDLLDSSSNLLESSLESSWKTAASDSNFSLAERYLSSVEQLIDMATITHACNKTNVAVDACNDTEAQCTNSVFNVTVTLMSSGNGSVKTAGFKYLQSYLPSNRSDVESNSIVVSTTTERKKDNVKIIIDFPLLNPRPRHVMIECVSWDNSSRQWSPHGCTWAGPSNEGRCTCVHLSSFAILMSKYPVEISGTTELTYMGLCVSIVSLIISLVVELVVWSDVVKTNTLYLRHTAHVNLSLCLLVADCCFLASSKPLEISEIWCKTFVTVKHFCYLSMFFWMLCLSTTLLHQAVFLFHQVSKKNYLKFSLVLGYACPLLIVFITFLTNKGGAEGFYFSRDTCWLVYSGFMSGSIFTFLIPVGIIAFVNLFSMLIVIMKLLDHHKTSDKSHEQEKAAVKTVMRSVILLTPVFGVTWLFGFAVMIVDLTSGPGALVVNYAFTLLNAFQGLFIFLTTCLGDVTTRQALLNHLKKKAPGSTTDSCMMLETTWSK